MKSANSVDGITEHILSTVSITNIWPQMILAKVKNYVYLGAIVHVYSGIDRNKIFHSCYAITVSAVIVDP